MSWIGKICTHWFRTEEDRSVDREIHQLRAKLAVAVGNNDRKAQELRSEMARQAMEQIEGSHGEMKLFIRNWLVQYFIIISVMFWVAAMFVPGKVLVIFANSLLTGVGVAVIGTWGRSAWKAVREGGLNGYEQIVAAPVAIMIPYVLLRVWMGGVIVLDLSPEYMTGSPVVAYLLLSVAVGASLYLTSPGTRSGVVPRQNWMWLTAAIAIGMMVAGFTLGLLLGA